MHLLGFHDIFTTKTSLTRVRAVPRYSFSVDTLEGLNAIQPTIGIMPSGLPWMLKHSKGHDGLFGSFLTYHYRKSEADVNNAASIYKPSGVEKIHQYMYSVPYSDHSCFEEIQEFIKLVQPASLKGIVTSSSCYVDPLYYFGRLCGENRVLQKVNDKNKKKERGKRVDSVQTKIAGNCKYRRKRRGFVNKVRALRRVAVLKLRKMILRIEYLCLCWQ